MRVFRSWEDSDIWIGFRNSAAGCSCDDACEECRDSLLWSDDSSITYHDWAQGKPDAGECARMTKDSWSSGDCDVELKYVCARQGFAIVLVETT